MPDTIPATRVDVQTPPMNGSEVVLQALVEQGVEVVFGYPGGAVLPIYDAIFKQDQIRHILVRHEQGAVHAAEGYARSTGKVGVVLVTSGPGATNTVTGLTDALMDSVPVVCLTGQVPTHMIGNDAFQEADTVGITRPCTKHNYLVKSPRRPGAGDPRGVPRRAQRPARAGRGRPAQGHPDGPGALPAPRRGQASHLQSQGRAAARADRAGGRADGASRAADLLRRRRRDQLRARGVGGAGPAGARDRLSDHAHADGARRLSGVGPAVPRHARHARHLRGQPRDARLRSDDRDRRALRRPGDRPPRQLLAGLEQDPHRHRPVVDQQERAGRRRDRRRTPAARSTPCSAAGGPRKIKPRTAQAQAVVGPDRRLAARRSRCAIARTARSSSRNTRSSGCTS